MKIYMLMAIAAIHFIVIVLPSHILVQAAFLLFQHRYFSDQVNSLHFLPATFETPYQKPSQ
jgi:hypothetical protein